MKKAGIVFTTYNNASSVEACLDSCMRQNYPGLEIFIADDGSTDDTVAVIRSKASAAPYPVTLLELPHGERGVARVKAVEAARQAGADYLLVIDSDMILDDHLLRGGIDYFEAHPEVGALVVPEQAFTHAGNFFPKSKYLNGMSSTTPGRSWGKGRSRRRASGEWKLMSVPGLQVAADFV